LIQHQTSTQPSFVTPKPTDAPTITARKTRTKRKLKDMLEQANAENRILRRALTLQGVSPHALIGSALSVHECPNCHWASAPLGHPCPRKENTCIDCQITVNGPLLWKLHQLNDHGKEIECSCEDAEIKIIHTLQMAGCGWPKIASICRRSRTAVTLRYNHYLGCPLCLTVGMPAGIRKHLKEQHLIKDGTQARCIFCDRLTSLNDAHKHTRMCLGKKQRVDISYAELFCEIMRINIAPLVVNQNLDNMDSNQILQLYKGKAIEALAQEFVRVRQLARDGQG
jgi:hypothetical protein